MSCKSLRLITATLLFLSSLPLLAQNASCTFTFFALPGFESTFAEGVNRYGNVVGNACDVESPNGCVNRLGFVRFADGTSKTVQAPSSVETSFSKRNASGLNVGYAITNAGKRLGVVNINASWEFVEFPGAVETQLTGINLYNTIVGQWTDAAGKTHSFRIKGAQFTTIAFPGATQTFAAAISDTGVVVGSFVSATGVHGFTLDTVTGVYKVLDHPDGNTGLNDINATGEIVGNRNGRPFMFKNGVFKNIVVPGASAPNQAVVLGVNGFGTVTGFSAFNGSTRSFIGKCQ